MFIKSGAGVAGHPKLHTYQEGYLLPILSYDELLFGPRHHGLLRQFFDLAELPKADYDQTYGELLRNFVEFVQVVPHKRGGVLGSLLNYGLARTSAVFQKYCHLKKEETSPLLKFAVFSAALLKNIGRIVSNQRIILTNDLGDYMDDWNPLSGSMIDRASYYKMCPINANYLRIESEVTPLLARQVIPHEAFLWLSSDLLVFSDWLAALLDEEGVGSRQLTSALQLAKREDIVAILSTLDGADADQKLAASTEQGDAFYHWLRESITSGLLALNNPDSGVSITPQGLFIDNKVFVQFAQLFRLPVNFMIIRAQFGNALGIIKRSGEDFFHANVFGTSDIMTNYASFSSHTQKHTVRDGVIAPIENIVMHTVAENAAQSKSVKQPLISKLHQTPTTLTALQNVIKK